MKSIEQKLKALADKNRLKIIKLLLSKNYCVKALAQNLNISESAVSQQLKILRKAKLVVGEKRGYFVHYRVQRGVLDKIGKYVIQLSNLKKDNSGCCHEIQK
ncbi:MAG: metalloregulator ArsR/SmtB family transcription factor [Candidatus Marinimicrobia bacterium]|nr:metalloregulator ArsR/SmtB family transcription factor [Candidatus Neomarinimicrobiota bacterium]